MDEFGSIKFHLAQVLANSGISKNKICKRTGMQRTQLNNYCNNNISRLDMTILAKLCTALSCDITDLIEFIPPSK